MKRITRILFAQRQIITQGCALASKHNTAISELVSNKTSGGNQKIFGVFRRSTMPGSVESLSATEFWFCDKTSIIEAREEYTEGMPTACRWHMKKLEKVLTAAYFSQMTWDVESPTDDFQEENKHLKARVEELTKENERLQKLLSSSAQSSPARSSPVQSPTQSSPVLVQSMSCRGKKEQAGPVQPRPQRKKRAPERLFLSGRRATRRKKRKYKELLVLHPTYDESGFANALSYPFNPRVPLPQQWTTTRALSSISPSVGRFRSLNFVQNVLDEDSQRQSKRDIVHILMKRKKTFVTVTDEQGNKKFGASAGSLEETKGRSRQSRYAAESTAEQVGRTCRKMGLKSVVIKVKGAVYFRKKRKVIMSWRDGFRGEGLGARTRILSVQDETQLAHNGCRLPKKRRI